MLLLIQFDVSSMTQIATKPSDSGTYFSKTWKKIASTFNNRNFESCNNKKIFGKKKALFLHKGSIPPKVHVGDLMIKYIVLSFTLGKDLNVWIQFI